MPWLTYKIDLTDSDNIMKNIIFLLAIIIFVSGCMHTKVEMPTNDAPGSDHMKRSPCACKEIEFNPSSYRWLS